MATRFYFPSSGTPPVTNIAFDANWSNTASAVKLPLKLVKGKTALTNFNVTETTSASVHNVLVAQFISEPLIAQDLSGTVVGMIQAMENNSSADYNRAIVIKLVNSNGALIGNLYSNFPSSLTERLEFGNSLSSRFYPQSTAITNMTSSLGDRIVIEVGFKVHNTKSTQYIGTLRFGENGNSDIPYLSESNSTTTLNPSIEFSANILFSHTVQISMIGNGTINPVVGTYTYTTGDTLFLTATNSNNDYFVKWVIDGIDDFKAKTSVLINCNMVIVAYYETKYTLTVNKIGTGFIFPYAGNNIFLENTTVSLNASGYFSIQRTNSNRYKLYPNLQVVDNIIYYNWMEDDNALKIQLFMATSNLDGSNFVSKQLTNTAINKNSLCIFVNNGIIYYFWNEVDSKANNSLWLATSNLDGSNFNASLIRNTTTFSCNSESIIIIGNTIYYSWLEQDSSKYSQVWLATSNLDGSNFVSKQLTNTAIDKSNKKTQIIGNTIYYNWYDVDSALIEQLSTATSNLDGSNFNVIMQRNSEFHKSSFNIQVVNNIIYYFWLEMNSSNKHKLFMATSNLDGSNFVSKQPFYSNNGLDSVNFHIVGNTIYYIFVELYGNSKLLNTATSNIDGSNFVSKQLFSTLKLINSLSIQFVNNIIHYLWFEEGISKFELFTAVHVLNQNFVKWVIDGVDIQTPITDVYMSKNITATAYLEIPLSDVTNLSVSKISVNSLRLNWTPSNSQDILYLELFKDEVALSPRPDNSTGSYIINNIDTTKAYTFTIYVYDSNLKHSNGASIKYYPSTPIINSIAWSKNPCNTNEATLLQVSVIEE